MCAVCKASSRARYRNNRDKCLEYSRKRYEAKRELCLSRSSSWKKKNRKRVKFLQRRNSLQSRYGITIEQYDAMLSKQDGVCLTCERPCLSGLHLAVDHDHDTGLIRGLLCRDCNTVLGKVNESVEILRKMITHIVRNKRRKHGLYVPKSQQKRRTRSHVNRRSEQGG